MVFNNSGKTKWIVSYYNKFFLTGMNGPFTLQMWKLALGFTSQQVGLALGYTENLWWTSILGPQSAASHLPTRASSTWVEAE